MIIILVTTFIVVMILRDSDSDDYTSKICALGMCFIAIMMGIFITSELYDIDSVSKTFKIQETCPIVCDANDDKADIQMVCEDGTQYYYVITDNNGIHKYEKLKVKETTIQLVPDTSQNPYLEKGTETVDNLILYSIPIPSKKTKNIIYCTEDMKIEQSNNFVSEKTTIQYYLCQFQFIDCI